MTALRSRWRRFLEPTRTEVDSYVLVEIPSKDGDQSALLKIADCDRHIRLWFPWWGKPAIERTRLKIAVLREALDRLEAGVEKLHEDVLDQ